jgi:hypothetical protein
MAQTLDGFAFWLRGTQVSEAIRAVPWLWPLCEILHFSGLSLLVGVAAFFDLRLLGFMKRIPLAAAWSLMPWARVGFAVSACTGITFFIGAPDQYVNNIAFLWKVTFLLVAGLNATLFETKYVVLRDLLGADAAVHRQRVLTGLVRPGTRARLCRPGRNGTLPRACVNQPWKEALARRAH